MATRTVADVMTAPVVSVTPQTSYREIVDLLAEHGISAMPVVGPDGAVLGVVSEADLLHKLALTGEEPQRRLFERRRRAVARAKAAGDTAEDLMTSPAVVVRPGASVVEAARIMENEQLKRLPVVSGNRLVGMVSRRDLLRTYRRSDEAIRHDVVHDVIEGMLFVQPPQIDAEVVDGVVRLTGATGRRSTAQIAEHLVRTVPGVVDVVNELTSEWDDTARRERRHDFDAEVDGPQRPRDGTLDMM
ncbi:CBS domain-containing protein [Catellatospora tritici]|uniref:CBS domain-containing protein n=1 Tax=Catellatospora tritici TaxID=2851566 RepID=UPI001C2D5422|nr:CBS domain-containing protein [Catellatospora tritici]MBV1851701.1 CBS domain-containing protein [Catellatospora tritici]